MSIRIVKPGLLTSLQDLGRYGFQKYGVIVSGAMDTVAHRIANMLVGNKEYEAALEMTMLGPTLLIEHDTLIAITGSDMSPSLNGESIPMWRPVLVKGGSLLQLGACRTGCRSYLAVAGGFEIPEILGSKSTYLRAGLGGYQGRALQAGDDLALVEPSGLLACYKEQFSELMGSSRFVSTGWYTGRDYGPKDTQVNSVRVTKGSHFEYFDAESQALLFREEFRVGTQSDRMGYRLSGPKLSLAEPLELISESVILGTVQVPPDGNLIILLADRQTAGGYPRIAHIAMVDIPLVAQLQPGRSIRLVEISIQEAENLYIARERHLRQMKAAIQLKWNWK